MEQRDYHIKLYDFMNDFIKKKNYYEANNCLYELKKELINIKFENDYDFGLIEALLAYLNDCNANLFVSPLVYSYYKIEDEDILNKYSALLDYVIDLDFSNAIILANELNILVKEKGLEIDFTSLCFLLNACLKKQKFGNEIISENIIKKYLKLKDYQILYKIIVKNVEALPKNYNIYKIIMILVENGLIKEAVDLYNRTNLDKRNNTIDRFLKNATNEENIYDGLKEEVKERYKNTLYRIRKYIDLENYDAALDLASEYYYITGAPIFLYYMAKSYYKLSCYDDAKKLLMLYIENGSIKLRRSFELLAECYEKLRMFPIEIPKKYRKYYNSFIAYTGSVKKSIFTKVNNTGEIDVFHIIEHPLYKELENLYLKGCTKQADKKIVALENQTITPEEKDVLKLIRNNKKMLVRKSKYDN